ncbi:MAG: DUF4153 domain-containing protein [Anaerolineales bacterium]
MIRRNWIWWIALAAAAAFDYLFWGHTPGISFFVFVVVCLAAGILSAAASGVAPNGKSAILIPCILASAAVTFLRTEPFTAFCGGALALGLMMILAYTYRGGQWPLYGIVDHLIAAFRLVSAAALHPALLPPEKKNARESPGRRPAWRRWIPPVLRGLALALPIVLVFAALLSAADPVFEKALQYVFDIQRLPEYIFRLCYVLIGMYLLAGVFLYAAISSRAEQPAATDAQRIKPFIGFIEAAVVLGSVGALFAVFVAIQFRYFFGGVENITAEGFTYAEYARRGFGELVAVACGSLLLLLGLGSLTRREGGTERRIFSVLSILLVAMVVVMLVSSYRRLTLYEDAYGFTRLRMYTHVFILWLGVLLVAVTGLEFAGRIRHFSAAAIAVAFGFALTLAVVNVDAAIVRSNGLRSDVLADGAGDRRSTELDTAYFVELSADAVPELLQLYDGASSLERDRIGADLSCRLMVMEQNPRDAWQSYLWPVAEALRLLRASGVAEEYPVYQDRGWLVVSVNGEYERCGGQAGWMD